MSVMEDIVERLEPRIKVLFVNEKSGHDLEHLKRVMGLALKIQSVEGGNRTVIGISAFLHDTHRALASQAGKHWCSPSESLPFIRKLLRSTELEVEVIENILHCIERHEETNFMGRDRIASDKETLIVQDADNLDAIGAIGLARAFTYGGAHGMKIWDGQEVKGEEQFDIDVNSHTSIKHFYDYLLRMKDNMNTETGKRLARQKHKFMEEYLGQFFAEHNLGDSEP